MTMVAAVDPLELRSDADAWTHVPAH
jgi:hypothetical protein